MTESFNAKTLTLAFSVFLCSVFACLGANADFGGTRSEWNGFERYDFVVDERACIVVTPKKVAEGKPWIWRARFFGHEPQTDIALLHEGYHLVYCDVAGLFGAPKAVSHWNAFYEVLTQEHGFAKRPALEGMSRGGLIIYNWAKANPEKVGCIYADAPVCDIKSWPGGKGAAKGDPASWKQCLDAYGLTETEAMTFSGNPIDGLAPLAKAGVPLLHVVGDADDVVPVAENTAIVEQRYRELGGSIQVIHKPGVGHHPHSLKDPGPIVAFVRKHTQPNVRRRSHFENSRLRFERDGTGRVAFIGGSITEMEGYRGMVCKDLQERFPKTQFEFTDAGISSTCSTTGAFRLTRDVLSKGPVDLFLIEFAVNDDQDAAHARQQCIRGLEGIIAQTRKHSPNADIMITYFVNEGMLAKLQNGVTPLSIAAHEDVAQHWQVSSCNLAKEVAEQISDERLTWQVYGGVHPKPEGNRIAAGMIAKLLDEAWSEPLAIDAKPTPHVSPSALLDDLSYANARFIELESAKHGDTWTITVPDWKTIPGSKRDRFSTIPLLCSSVPGAELTLHFSGTAVGAFVVAGPDAGILEASVDGSAFKTVDLYHRFSKTLHYPRTVMLGTELSPGEHTLTVRLSKETISGGHAARIIQFVAN
jgi:pimeloyl-ACP methyl ester carboxylesterase/lysophospholipase L1-like esterase